MDFVDDDDLSGEREKAEGCEAGRKDGEEGLVDGAGAEGSEELSAGGGEPAEGFVGIVVIGFRFLRVILQSGRQCTDVALFQPGVAVDEGLYCFGVGDLFKEGLYSSVNSLGRELGG